ncbi:MAG: NUDIX hydrolase [Anaerolineae bacterium]|nr:NUDIX hydrolase [Anaerolineae bacterium]
MPEVSPFTVLESRIAWQCPWYAVRQDRLRLPGGGEGVYNVVEKGDAVWIVPVTAAGEIVLVRHYRHTIGAWCWEVPAGGIEPGQDARQAARAELRQEIGGVAENWRLLLRLSTGNGFCNEYGNLFLATGVQLGATAHEAAEVMTVHRVPAAEAIRMARRGEVDDALSALALLLAEPLLAEQLLGGDWEQTR